MSEPKWMNDLDAAMYRAMQPVEVAAAWAWFAIARLPEAERRLAAKSWLAGKLPREVPELPTFQTAPHGPR